uniref:Uncharacterized protein n=1 Tax=Bicosoecida sp. CB-2014 TaxID=1486930 RepID=A0A6T6YTM6_9STRA|mmetsp:Transcript_5306/g.19050  ORF Transcript_5306/g.19050 Transcript_5306/m.19050 type:complete len:169 (+) Transcript_5306:1126-1632(+)
MMFEGAADDDPLRRCVPVYPTTVQVEDSATGGQRLERGGRTRKQIPLSLAWAMTTYRSQGLTLGYYTFDPDSRAYTQGADYTGFSRASDVNKLAVVYRPFERYMRIFTPAFKARAAHEARVRKLALQTLRNPKWLAVWPSASAVAAFAEAFALSGVATHESSQTDDSD